MTFFYNLNKTLDAIREKPELTHGQLNERDMGKHNNATTGFKAVADKAAKEYGSKAAGERVAGAVKAKMAKAGKLEEQDMDESAFQAAIGKKKYGDEGMKALQKAGREHASDSTMSNIRNKYDKYDEGIGDMAKKVGGMAKKVGGAVLDKLGHGSDEDMIRDLQKKAGVPQHGQKGMAQPKEGVDKQKFAALAPPTDKITFADKIAGAKKEVDEMLGDVAANAMKSAITSKGGEVTKAKGVTKHKAGPGVYGGSDKEVDPLDRLKGPSKKKLTGKQETDEGWDDMIKDVERRRTARKVGDVTHGAKHDTQEIPGGRRVTRRTDPNTGYSVGADDDTPASGEKRGRGRPKGTGTKVGAKGPSGKSKLMTKEADHDSEEVKQAMALLKKAGYTVSKGSEQELDEKAVSKKQQRFMGMVHATQKGEKAPSKEVGKVAKSMGKKDAEDFASTKHKGLPEKAPKKKEKTEEAGGTGTPTASSGFGFGQGIYDSVNHELEAMIAESMNISLSSNTEGGGNGGPSNSLTVTATDDDALYLAKILKAAGIGSGGQDQSGGCGCGSEPCTCDQEVDEAYGDATATPNSPNWPTNTETAQDNLEYAGGLNKPKSTGQTTTPVIASQDDRQHSYAENEEDAIKRMMEMAGIKEAKKVEEDDMEEGNKFTGNLAKARAAGKKEADLDGDGDMEKVDESIFAATNSLWSEYKGKYGV